MKKKEDIVASNSIDSSNPLLLLASNEIIKEFIMKEKYFKKVNIIEGHEFGFFDQNGEEALNKRGFFKKFFDYTNLISLTPTIENIVKKHLNKLIEDNWKNDKSDLKSSKIIDLNLVLCEIFYDIVDYVLVGEEFAGVKIDGMRLTQAVNIFIENLGKDRYSAMNSLTGGLYYQLKISSQHRRALYLKQKLTDIIWEIYQKRAAANKPPELNILDLIIQFDSQQPENKKWTKEDITSHFILFQSAGSDTTKHFTSFLLEGMAIQPNIQECYIKEFGRLLEEKGNTRTIFDIVNDDQINILTQESLRLFGPTLFTTKREAIKNVKLGKYKISKGDRLLVGLSAKNRSEVLHEKAMEFNPERMGPKDTDNLKRMDFIPFSFGQRVCIGQFLAVMINKTIVFNILESFKIEQEPTFKREVILGAIFGLAECTVKLTPKQ